MNANEKEIILKKIRELKSDYCFEIVQEIEDKRLNFSASIELDHEGLIYMPSTFYNQIICYDKNFKYIKSCCEKEGLIKPIQLLYINEHFIVLEGENGRILSFTKKWVLSKTITTSECPDLPLDKDSRIFKWDGKIGLINKAKKFLGLLNNDLKLETILPLPDVSADLLYVLKEVDNKLLLPLVNGEIYSLNGESVWVKETQFPFADQTFKYVSDIIHHKNYWIVFDHLESTLYKFSEKGLLLKWKSPERYLLNGVSDGEFVYVTRSRYLENGSGNLYKIRM